MALVDRSYSTSFWLALLLMSSQRAAIPLLLIILYLIFRAFHRFILELDVYYLCLFINL